MEEVDGGFDRIVAHGNRGHHHPPFRDPVQREGNWITCADGFRVSVIAGGGAYCAPKPVLCACAFDVSGRQYRPPTRDWEVEHDYPGPYTAVEVGFPSQRPEPWDVWRRYAEEPDRPTDTVYATVPVELVRALIAVHGGEIEEEL